MTDKTKALELTPTQERILDLLASRNGPVVIKNRVQSAGRALVRKGLARQVDLPLFEPGTAPFAFMEGATRVAFEITGEGLKEAGK